MDVQLAAAHFAGLGIHNSDFFVILGTVIGNQDRGSGANDLFHRAILCRAVRKDHADGVTSNQRIRLNVHSHVAIQRKNCQCTVFRHAGSHIGAFFRVNVLDTAGDTCCDGAADLVRFCIGDLVIQFINGCLSIGQSLHDSCHVHRCQDIALCHCVVKLNFHILDLHAGRDRQRFQVHILQRSTAGNHGMEGSGGCFVGQDFIIGHGKLLTNPTLQTGYHDNQNHCQHQYNDQDRQQYFALALFL